MTKLTTPIRRESSAVDRGKPIIIQLEPPQLIRLKRKGDRDWYTVTVQTVYEYAALMEANNKLKARKGK